jgi:hypothetical protein
MKKGPAVEPPALRFALAEAATALPNVTDIDRSSMNAWEDANFAFAAVGLIWGSNFIVAIVEQLNFK